MSLKGTNEAYEEGVAFVINVVIGIALWVSHRGALSVSGDEGFEDWRKMLHHRYPFQEDGSPAQHLERD